MKHLNDYIFEAKTFSEIKKDILKALKITSWDKGGINNKLRVHSVKKQNKTKSVPEWLANLNNDNYDKIVIEPNYSYLNKSEYKSKVISSFNKLGSINGCSYQLISDNKEFEELTKTVAKLWNEYPMVVISVPKDGDTPELPGIPERNDDDLPKTNTPTEENNDKKIKFWCTGVGSMSVDYMAYGAMGDHWKPNFARIKKHIGENKFTTYYTELSTKKFTSYKSLFNYLKKMHKSKYAEFSLVDEEKLIEASYDNSYYIKSFYNHFLS